MKKIVCLIIVFASLFLASCGGKATGTTQTEATENPTPITAPYTSASHYAAVDTPSRILLFHGGTLFYYSKADGESYHFCFDPLCRHPLRSHCVARQFMSHTSRIDACVYSEKYNRFYFARGQKIYSTSFDASDLKLELSLGENGIIDGSGSQETMSYDFYIRRIRIYGDYIYFLHANDDSGKWQILRYNIITRKAEEMTSGKTEWVISYELANEYIYFKTLDNNNYFKYYTTDMDFNDRKVVTDPIYFENPGVSMGLYDGKYFYDETARGKELYRLDPLTNEKELIVKDDRLTGCADMLCVKENDGVYVTSENVVALGYIIDEVHGKYDVGTNKNIIWRVSFDGEFTKVLDFQRGQIDTMNFVDGGVVIHFSRIYHKEINVEDPKTAGSVFVLFEIDENGMFVNPKPIGNNADNEDLIEFFNGDWQ